MTRVEKFKETIGEKSTLFNRIERSAFSEEIFFSENESRYKFHKGEPIKRRKIVRKIECTFLNI